MEISRAKFGYRKGRLKMMEDLVGKTFIKFSTNGDLPTNPMSLREFLVCGECSPATSRGSTMKFRAHRHHYSPLPSLGRGSKSELKTSNMAVKPNIPNGRAGSNLQRARSRLLRYQRVQSAKKLSRMATPGSLPKDANPSRMAH
jgi:hypothetical protein